MPRGDGEAGEAAPVPRRRWLCLFLGAMVAAGIIASLMGSKEHREHDHLSKPLAPPVAETMTMSIPEDPPPVLPQANISTLFAPVSVDAQGSSSKVTSSPKLGGGVLTSIMQNAGRAGDGLCYPRDGKELMAAVANRSCTFIYLRNFTHPYLTTKEMAVNATKVIMGNPLLPPIINGSKAERVFRGKS
jgi:hypothetical protein